MKTIGAKVSDELFKQVKKMADEKNITISNLIKQTLKKNKIINTSIEKKIINTSIEKKIAYEINRIGNNLNQIARHCNIKKKVDREVLLKLSIIEKILKELKK